MARTVNLSTEEVVDATLVFVAIQALGKLKEFRNELGRPNFDASMHKVALAQILQNRPQIVPSFQRLDKAYQDLIIRCLRVDFHFDQFLQAEATPASLAVVRETLMLHGNAGFAFFFFNMFAHMCGNLGSKSLKCSLFMDELQFQRFRTGLDALQELKTTQDAAAAYNSFLLL